MKKNLILLTLILTANFIEAQFIKEKSINAQIGYGLTIPYNSADEIAGDGFFLQGEYIMKIASWVELRPYAGLILTKSSGKDINNNPSNERAETKAFLIGGKARLRAPIPWVAPYIEFGIGGSIGTFETFTAYTNISKKGFVYHIPVSLGLELGRNNNVDIGFSYYYQPSIEQFSGAFAVGVSIPLKN